MTRTLFLGAALLLAACSDGPHENSGEVADANAGYTSSEDSPAQGPGERAGQAIDNAIEEQKEAVEERADSIRSQADAAAEQLDAEADRLEDKADRLREDAEKAADAVKGQ